jgi:DNA repair exonuclease SbcCD ATPase subunit
MTDTDQNLCPHCGQPMPKETVVKLGTPAATQGTNTVEEENQKTETSLSWEGETVTVDDTPTEIHADDTLVKEILDAHYEGDEVTSEEVKEESLPEQVERLNQKIEENKD